MKRHLFILSLVGLFLVTLLPASTYAQDSPDAGNAPNAEEIVGGRPASPGEYPWQVMLLRGSQKQFWCGGSLIAPRWVLTAAHCLGNIRYVAVGAHRYGGNVNEADRQVIAVKREIGHPKYEVDFDLGYDIALLELKTPATLNDRVQTIALAQPGQDDNLLNAGRSTTVTGWGALSENGGDPDVLQTVNVSIVARNVCNRSYGGDILADMICAGVPNGTKDSCYGDSGGPLITRNGNNGWKQIGVVSWGRECALKNFPGVYTSVPFFDNWIESYVPDTSVPPTPRPTTEPTPVPTPTPRPPAGNLVKNGDFESGDNGDWRERSSNGYALIDNGAPIAPSSGNYLAWLAGVTNEKSRLIQNVTLPANTDLVLSYQYRIAPDGACRGNIAKVFVNRTRLVSYSLCDRDATGGWQQELIDLSRYAGRTVKLQFFAKTKGNNQSDLFIDDVIIADDSRFRDGTSIRIPDDVEDEDATVGADEGNGENSTPTRRQNFLFLPYVQK